MRSAAFRLPHCLRLAAKHEESWPAMIHLPFPEAWQYRDFGHANALMQGDLASTLLARLGIQVKPGNRLDRARKLVRGLEGESGIRHSLDTDFMERLQDALETIGQLFVIAALMVENP